MISPFRQLRSRFAHKALYGILMLSFILAGTQFLRAKWAKEGDQDMPVCTATNEQHFPDLTTDGQDGAIVAWRDARSENRDVFAQRVSATGEMLWESSGIPVCDLPSAQTWPIVVADGSGGAIIVFGDGRNGNQDIYAQRINGNGQALWQKGGIPVCVHSALKGDMRAISDEEGNTIVVWEDWRDENQDIYAQKINNDGSPMWIFNGAPVYRGDGDQYDPFLTTDDAGGAIFVWWDISTDDWDIFAQRLNAEGEPVWGSTAIAVCTATGHQGSPFVIPDGVGGVFSVWSDYRNDPNLLTSADLYVQRIDAAGNPAWEKNGIALCNAPSNQQVPEGISDGAGGLIVAWRDDRDIFSDIYAQRLSPDGKPMWEVNGIPVCAAEGEQRKPALVSDGSQGAIVYWLDYREDYGDVTHDAIYAQLIDANGKSVWALNGVPVCTAEGNQITPKATADGNGGAIIVWGDARGTDPDIYIQRVP